MRSYATTFWAAAVLTLTAGPSQAEGPELAPVEACRRIVAEARAMKTDGLACEPGSSALIISGVTQEAARALEPLLFPGSRYHGHAVLLSLGQDGRKEALPQAVPMPKLPMPADDRTVSVDFDHAGGRGSLAAASFADFLAGDILGTGMQLSSLPPGSARADAVTPPSGRRVSLPPGGGVTPPPGGGGSMPPGRRVSPPRGGGLTPPPGRRVSPPPGGGGALPPGGIVSPPPIGGGSIPPSRPAPVWRSVFSPPSPNWWNTEWDSYDWWEGLPSGYDRGYSQRRDEDTFLYYSPWHLRSDLFVTPWTATGDAAEIVRTRSNQDRVHSVSLTSRLYRDAKQCYYQAVYRYDWAQGGFEGSHWEERFDHYNASCIRLPREFGPTQTAHIAVSFDMGMVLGTPDLPWESDRIRVSYDGRGAPQYDFSGASFRYTLRLDDRIGSSDRVTMIAGPKVLRQPERNAVQAFLRINGGKLEFVVNDARAQYYRGETLRVSAHIVHRVVVRIARWWWFDGEENHDTVLHSQPVDIMVKDADPQLVVDLTAAANATPKLANTKRSSVFIQSWEFSRTNSKLSSGDLMRQGEGNSVGY
ncbi:MAG: hypothetical protein WC943_09685 [Elusimicrobiota bacterium]|jgi:hypothetical protein